MRAWAVLFLIATLSLPAHSEPAPIILNQSGAWAAVLRANEYAEVASYRDGLFELILPKGSGHFHLRLYRAAWSFAPDQHHAVDVSFDSGETFHFVGLASGNAIQVALDDGQMASWTHDMTALRVMTVAFPQTGEPPWIISLSGTTATVTAMAGALAAAGITDLPRPWSTGSTVTQSPPAQLQASALSSRTGRNMSDKQAKKLAYDASKGDAEALAVLRTAAAADDPAALYGLADYMLHENAGTSGGLFTALLDDYLMQIDASYRASMEKSKALLEALRGGYCVSSWVSSTWIITDMSSTWRSTS
jgi:hypothetical protein